MEVKMELRGKRSRQQLERETDETIQQIVAKAKVVPIVQKKSIQVIIILHSYPLYTY
jgi:hypothetical protein